MWPSGGRVGGDAADQPGVQGETVLLAEEKGGAGDLHFVADAERNDAADHDAGVRLNLGILEAQDGGRAGLAQREGIPLGVELQDFVAGEGLADLDPGGRGAGSPVLEAKQRLFRGDKNAGELDGGGRASGHAECHDGEGKSGERAG